MPLINFCPDCSNILYPCEDKANRVLLFACRNCDHKEESSNNCVYRHEVTHIPSEQTMVVKNLSSDPTLPRTTAVYCPRCSKKEAVFFQSQSRHPDTRMTLYYVCTDPHCQHRWQ
ncbi:DNA-directed RNA polymerase II subunit RPB9 [Coemansia erecta]|uniref:DNA-directed RNA polymerase subunit n=1 Tax=Coemansia asiatica TaxID=1052880 RepID=A0A9W7XKD2_9FUNG|nr:DNA-directed RNA polymerase II subunit RPB9 [Coemansia asiatica]KAJ2855577.1 DNA-directed RNA polymerase II subunit RPB9 [Coemansia erecta]KAJ2885375.1 DNA-directed RNA polymerase II subunit RPB9 [Coemansia asiatica]